MLVLAALTPRASEAHASHQFVKQKALDTRSLYVEAGELPLTARNVP
jgi:hypothetical protein